jgi:hypothetical protein
VNSDTVTILRSRGRRLAKLVKSDDQIVGYDEARTFTMIEHDVENLAGLHRLLIWLSVRPDRCIVRGALINPTINGPIRRLLHCDQETGDRPTLYEVPRFWIATDWDALDKPDDVDVTDPAACGRVALERLPPAFQRAAAIVCATGSHGVKPGIRVRLWQWLDRAITGREIERWLSGVAGLDVSVFRPAQAIYTAAPVFEAGSDPLANRVALIVGDDRVIVPPPEKLAPPAPKQARPLPETGTIRADTEAWSALRDATARVSGAAVSSRHVTILSEAARLARFVHRGLLTASSVENALVGAARDAGKPAGEAEAIFAWVMKQPHTNSRAA